MQSLTPNAYLGLWEHMLTHDLADKITGEFHPDDRFRQLCEDPFKVTLPPADGAMLRIVDIEQAFALRPFVGARPAAFTVQVEDRNLPWNNGAWRIEGAEGQMRAEQTDAVPDAEMSVSVLASLFSGYVNPRIAFGCGFARLNRPEALEQVEQAFAVLEAPFCPDYY
jgi:predicted acetyltransferase